MKNFWKKKKESYQEHIEIEKSPQIAGHGGLTRVDTGNRGPRPSYRRAFAKAELTEHLPGAAALTQQDRGGARREGSGDAAGAEEAAPGRTGPARAPRARLRRRLLGWSRGRSQSWAAYATLAMDSSAPKAFPRVPHSTCASVLFPCLYVHVPLFLLLQCFNHFFHLFD